MTLKPFKDWNLFSKISTITIISIVLMLISIRLFVVPLIEKNVMADRQLNLQNVIDLSFAVVTKYDQQVRKGILAKEAAMKLAADDIKILRYGADQKEYVWINDAGTPYPRMVMHPVASSLDGKVMDDPKYNCAMGKGQNLFQAFVEVSQKGGSGFVDYLWPKPGSEELVAKLSYVKLFEPWGWILGTGVYIDDVDAIVSAIKFKILGVILLTSLITLALTFYIAQRISNRLKEGVKFAEKVATGDLTNVLNINQKDEVGDLAKALNEMVGKLAEMFKDFVGSSESLSSSSTELAAVSDQLTTSSSQISGQVGSITAAVEEMNASVTSISAAAEHSLMGVDAVSMAAKEMTDNIGEISQNTEKANETTKQAVEDVAKTLETINKLGIAADEIDRVTDTIYEISEQTNLLALNATIEAARAGEAGKGFAVVAAEIKDLATQTTRATGEIDRRVKAIQVSTQDAVQKIKDISTVIYNLNDVVSIVTSSLREQASSTNEIVNSIGRAHQGVEEISENLSQMAASSEKITNDIARVHTSTDEASEGSRQINLSAEDLSEMAARLNQSLNRFQF
ncbi:MAG: methyl-accepting chemotaxis protein [Pseudomonadota bacterium]